MYTPNIYPYDYVTTLSTICFVSTLFFSVVFYSYLLTTYYLSFIFRAYLCRYTLLSYFIIYLMDNLTEIFSGISKTATALYKGESLYL